MSRPTDEQVGQLWAAIRLTGWVASDGTELVEVLNALVAERDAAVSWQRTVADGLGMSEERGPDDVWVCASADEVVQQQSVLVGTLVEQLQQAESWAAWFAAERDLFQSQLQWLVDDWRERSNDFERKWLECEGRLTAVRELHQPMSRCDMGCKGECSNTQTDCDECCDSWPCPTVRALDGEVQ